MQKITNWSEYNKSLEKRGAVTVWFSDDAIKAWTDWKRPSSSRKGGRKGIYGDAAILCGIPPIRFHDLRHTYASILAMHGVSLYKVKSLMGHSSYAMTERYAHLAKETLHDAVNQSLERLV